MAKFNTSILADLQVGMEELGRREMHPLKVYRPTPQQQAFHESRASQCLVRGGKRCLPGWQNIYDPVADLEIAVDEIGGPFHVNSIRPENGEKITAAAGQPFIKGEDRFYRFHLSNGQRFDATLDHEVLTSLGWLSLREICEFQQKSEPCHLLSIEGTFQLGFPRDGRRWSETAPDYLDDYSAYYHPCDVQPPWEASTCLAAAPSPAGVLGPSSCDRWKMDGLGSKSEHSHPYQSVARPSSPCALVQTFGPSASFEYQAAYKPCSQLLDCVPADGQSLQRSASEPHTTAAIAQYPSDNASPSFTSHKEVSVVDVEYLGKYKVWDFEVPETGNYSLAGIVHHNSGKTLSAAMEFASRVLGVPITRADGTKIPLRYPKPTKKNPKLYWVIGFDVKHIGQTIYHRLFSPGLGCGFRVINDKQTGTWKAWNRNEEPDREDESLLSPPLLGDHLIVPGSWHMESAAGNIFNSVRLTNGATICAYASTGDHAKQGDAVDGIWIDEDVVNAEFVKEWDDRRISTRGWLIWSVWPHVANFALVEKLQEADRLAEEPEEQRYVQSFQLIGSHNPYSDKQGIREGLATMGDDDEIAHRDRGDIEGMLGSMRMYDFGTQLHIVKPKELERTENIHQLLCSLLQRFGRLPDSWTRYLAIDPSNTRTACLSGVVPPREWENVDFGNCLIIEGELVLRRHSPQMLADALVTFLGPRRYEAFIMDQQIGRQTTVGMDVTVFEAYGRELAKKGLVSRLSKSGFMRGCPDKARRRRTVRLLLEPTENGWPRLFVVDNKTAALQKEFSTYQKKRVLINGKQEIVDEPVNERNHDVMAALEYLCQYVWERFEEGTAYLDPEHSYVKGSGAYHAAQAMRATLEATHGSGYVHFGPGAHA